jgi:hypothetical protein
MDIHQLQVSYQMEQDRLLVRLNTHSGEELRLWLTRRMIKNLFPHMIRASIETDASSPQLTSHDGADSRALSQFRKQESLQQSDFQTAFKGEASVLPMGSEPLLVTTVHITPLEAGSLRLSFEENTAGPAPGRSCEVILAPALLHGFMHLLESALKHSDWGLTLAEPGEAPDSANLDPLATALPPKYLN